MLRVTVTQSWPLTGLDANLVRLSKTAFQAQMKEVLKSAKRHATSGRPGLIRRTGALERGIKLGPLELGGQMRQSLLTTVIYGRIHELGGTITAKKGPYMTFPINGRWVRVRSVTIPARPYLAPAMEEGLRNWPQIADGVAAAFVARKS